MTIKITVVVPTYRRPKLLSKCLQALLKQTFNRHAFEIIVVSDGPDELTNSEMDKWTQRQDHHVKYLTMPVKKGPAAARNYGWLSANSALIAFTDDDCVPDERWLQSFYECYNTGENIAFTGKTIVPVSRRPTDYELNTAGLQNADFITANCCITKNALAKTGGFDERYTMAWREDSDLEFKLINDNIPVSKIHTAIVVHPVRQAPWGISIKEQKKTMFNALLYKKYPELYRQKIRQITPYRYYGIIAGFLMMMLGYALQLNLLTATGFSLWLFLTLYFVIKRLRSTRLTFTHVLEMIVTSLAIPFLSVYWQIYGAIKYKVMFI